tara:strand:- start:25422 stop:26345 length:924 start_codon:yes stop_codon:yes gene_type:complete
MEPFSVCAGVVAHNPKVGALHDLVGNLLACSRWVVIVDNASSDTEYLEVLARQQPGVTIVQNAQNRGVSGGVNQVIDHAREMKAEFVVAFDQDTKISPELINVLAGDLQMKRASGESVAAIGPLVVDDYTDHKLPFIRFRLPWNTRYRGETLATSERLVACDFLITSGCLMPMQTIDDVGAMNEALFIDNVDLEWCFRAMHKGYKIYGDFGAAIRQQIGENHTKIPFTQAVIRYHDYQRNYYMTRNRLWLYRQRYTIKAWVVHDVLRFILKFCYLLAFRGNRVDLVKSTLRGLIDSFAMKPYNSGGL